MMSGRWLMTPLYDGVPVLTVDLPEDACEVWWCAWVWVCVKRGWRGEGDVHYLGKSSRRCALNTEKKLDGVENRKREYRGRQRASGNFTAAKAGAVKRRCYRCASYYYYFSSGAGHEMINNN
ncbi:hypothetical protein E2C01_006105 [Portunus trituberculatus]|uniref:Uncharacterized protein n=1 Tax=Portunus trituberculatus TaxID=210409 RepID=A0A5B7D0W8_PORTR|nr:hypothetical protein [Portunus trituberculatus]